VTDPHSGQTKIKKKLGGAYPGQRRPNHGQFTPDATQFDSNGQAVVHFKAYGGGNALTLVQQDGSNQPVTGTATPEYIEGSFATGLTASIMLWLYSGSLFLTMELFIASEIISQQLLFPMVFLRAKPSTFKHRMAD
jgi:hypothetical protein